MTDLVECHTSVNVLLSGERLEDLGSVDVQTQVVSLSLAPGEKVYFESSLMG
jgi:hypothetical protein